MTTLVLTVIGDDRAGLVSALADVVDEHGGSWGRSQLAELAGKFAGIVTVEVPQDRVEALTAALEPLHGVLDTTVHEAAAASAEHEGTAYRLELVGNDHPGIVRQVSGALAEQGLSIESLESRTVPTPESGGQTFEAEIVLRPATGADLDALQNALEGLADDLMVDITLEAEES
ncbi:glycine cleavage system protein R [Ornithinimicrobium tianjinense]|uniref:Glycine cleavage system regulatory protein n=1 Tax=Ornithinimicrobium tianjinense TaxID=1195761 RepID=A0A917BPC7_9MICO|nr:ACT domain-containing protein [Ornithinimicrobium tianjinense]GGF51559.1 glycine cleavage system regulatory protein [Ornithinimicrobium tianjinense]